MSSQEVLVLNNLFVSFMGEQSVFGIGTPVIFVRFQGCNLRCYKKQFGTCDTPESLEVEEGDNFLTPDEVVEKVVAISKTTGIRSVCVTGGEPLLQDKGAMKSFLEKLSMLNFPVVVETNGTKPINDYKHIKGVYFVVDYKTTSAEAKVPFYYGNTRYLDPQDFLKFVLYDEEDYHEMCEVLKNSEIRCRTVVGITWKGQLSYEQLIKFLQRDLLFGKVSINVQLHKLTTTYDHFKTTRLEEIPEIFDKNL